jgi:hypothetical protein
MTTAGRIEIKWDGVRAIAYAQPGSLRLQSRNLHEITASYPELARLARALGSHRAVLDGEIVAFDADGRPSFGGARAAHGRQLAGAGAAPRAELPVTYVIFDLLWLDGHSLIERPTSSAAECSPGLGLRGERWQTPDHIVGARPRDARRRRGGRARGDRRQAARQPYEPGRRSGAWIKLKNSAARSCRSAAGCRERAAGASGSAPCWSASWMRAARCATAGASGAASAKPSSSGSPVRSGRSSARTRRLPRAARSRRAAPSSASRACSRDRLSRADADRHAAPADLRGAGENGGPGGTDAGVPSRAGGLVVAATEPSACGGGRGSRADALEPRQGPLSRRGFTKREVIDYYAAVAPVLLAHLQGRPLTVVRYPDGVDGKAFFQKQSPPHRPPGCRPSRCASERRRRIDFTLAEDLADARLAREPRRARAARAAGARSRARHARPRRLRPRPGPPAGVLECCSGRAVAARHLRAARPASFVKTSGSKGLQVYLPLAARRASRRRSPSRARWRCSSSGRAGARGLAHDEGAARRQGADRLEPERRAQDDGLRLLAARARAPHGLDAAASGTRCATTLKIPSSGSRSPSTPPRCSSACASVATCSPRCSRWPRRCRRIAAAGARPSGSCVPSTATPTVAASHGSLLHHTPGHDSRDRRVDRPRRAAAAGRGRGCRVGRRHPRPRARHALRQGGGRARRGGPARAGRLALLARARPPVANPDFLLAAFPNLGPSRREALKIAAGFRGEQAFDAGVTEERALNAVLGHLSRERTEQLARRCLELYVEDRLGGPN